MGVASSGLNAARAQRGHLNRGAPVFSLRRANTTNITRAFVHYLSFYGNTREAMTFYKICHGSGAKLTLQTFGEAHNGGHDGADRIIHARLSQGTMVLMASDTMPGMPFVIGNNVWITQECESVEEIERLFAAFSGGGQILMPLADQFWGAKFGMLVDKYGIN